jgi:hypothetical protein
MNPRAATLSIILALLAVPFPTPGQQQGKVYRIGSLGAGSPAPADTNPQRCPIQGGPTWQAIVEGLLTQT